MRSVPFSVKKEKLCFPHILNILIFFAMQSTKIVSPEDPPSMSMRSEFHHPRNEYGLHIDYQHSPSALNLTSAKDSEELVEVCGLVFKADPLTRELVLHDYSDIRPNQAYSQIGIRPGDILCKVTQSQIQNSGDCFSFMLILPCVLESSGF